MTAREALALPSAQITPDDQHAAAVLLLDVHCHIRASMEFRGCFGFQTKELRTTVIALVNQLLRRDGWEPQWVALREPDPADKRKQVHVGWGLSLVPSDAAYQIAIAAQRN